MTDHGSHAMSAEMRACIAACLNCYSVCMETISHVLASGVGRGNGSGGAAAEHVRLLQDCADICLTSANFMLRGSDQHQRTCALCAEICAMCARMCAQFADDPKMQACLDACARCAESCERMTAPAGVSYDKVVADSFPASDPPAQPTRV